MIVVFDMDNTLVGDFGVDLRPGVANLLKRLEGDGVDLALWTHSTKDRAQEILKHHQLDGYFKARIFREDYDPKGEGGLPKDIRRLGGHVLVDDDPMQIDFMKRIGREGLLVSSYRDGKESSRELKLLYTAIRKAHQRHRMWGWSLPLRDKLFRRLPSTT